MPRRFLKRILPTHADMKASWYMRPFDALLHDPALWATHRRSVLRAAALGLFIGFVPLPGHAIMAVAAAVYLRVNVPVSLILALIVNNPLTMVPVFFAGYWLGVQLLGVAEQPFDIALSWGTLAESLGPIWKPLFLGSLLLGTVAAIAGYWGLDLIWRIRLARRFRQRPGRFVDPVERRPRG